MTERKFDLAKAMANGGKCQTRSGASVRIICTDRRNRDPIVALVEFFGEESVKTFAADGSYAHLPSDMDLVNVPVKREGWVNVYPSHTHTSKGAADKAACPYRVACVRVEWEE